MKIIAISIISLADPTLYSLHLSITIKPVLMLNTDDEPLNYQLILKNRPMNIARLLARGDRGKNVFEIAHQL